MSFVVMGTAMYNFCYHSLFERTRYFVLQTTILLKYLFLRIAVYIVILCKVDKWFNMGWPLIDCRGNLVVPNLWNTNHTGVSECWHKSGLLERLSKDSKKTAVSWKLDLGIGDGESATTWVRVDYLSACSCIISICPQIVHLWLNRWLQTFSNALCSQNSC